MEFWIIVGLASALGYVILSSLLTDQVSHLFQPIWDRVAKKAGWDIDLEQRKAFCPREASFLLRALYHIGWGPIAVYTFLLFILVGATFFWHGLKWITQQLCERHNTQ